MIEQGLIELRQVQQFQNSALDQVQGRKMEKGSLASQAVDSGQSDAVKGFEQKFSGRMGGGAFGVALVNAGQSGLFVGQLLADDEFKQGDGAQSNREQTDQPHDASFGSQIQRSQGKRLIFQAVEVVFNPIFGAISADGLGECELGSRVVGGIHLPAKTALGLGESRLVEVGRNGEGSFKAHLGWSVTIGPNRTFGGHGGDLDSDQSLDLVAVESELVLVGGEDCLGAAFQ